MECLIIAITLKSTLTPRVAVPVKVLFEGEVVPCDIVAYVLAGDIIRSLNSSCSIMFTFGQVLLGIV